MCVLDQLQWIAAVKGILHDVVDDLVWKVFDGKARNTGAFAGSGNMSFVCGNEFGREGLQDIRKLFHLSDTMP